MQVKIILSKWAIDKILNNAEENKGFPLTYADRIEVTLSGNCIEANVISQPNIPESIAVPCELVPDPAVSIHQQGSVNRAAQDRYPSDDEQPSDHF